MKDRVVRIQVTPAVEIALLETANAQEALEASAEDAARDAYSSVLWPASLACARELTEAVRAGMTVIEAGAGTGLCALTSARLGARAIALDHDDHALDRIARAAALNDVAVETLRFDLASKEALPPGDVVVFADLLYELRLSRKVARRAIEAAASGARVLVGTPGRIGWYAFERLLARAGLAVEFHATRVQLPGEAAESEVHTGWVETRGRRADSR